MATTVVDQNLVNIKEINYEDKILGINVDLKEWQFPTDNGAVEWRKAYTLTIPNLPTGIASVTIKRTSSEMTDVSTTTWTAGSSAKSVEVRYGDVLTITATATAGYGVPTCGLSFSSGDSGNSGSGDTSTDTGGSTDTDGYCSCCGSTSGLIDLGDGQYVCEDCYASWG